MSYLERPLVSFPQGNIGEYSIDLIRKYYQTLYKKAEDKQNEAGQNIFGGHQHQKNIGDVLNI